MASILTPLDLPSRLTHSPASRQARDESERGKRKQTTDILPTREGMALSGSASGADVVCVISPAREGEVV
jgi:hypothetical protein